MRRQYPRQMLLNISFTQSRPIDLYKYSIGFSVTPDRLQP